MPIVNRVAALAPEITEWRRDFHAHPELLYDVRRTARLVAERLRAFGCDEVVEGIGQTGVVGVIHGRGTGPKRVIGMRADMDALPIAETTGLDYASTVPGKMHACGHDGHTAMLLGAARYLAETRNFSGTAVVIFQPAEEGGAGGKAMVDDGMMERWGIEEVYGMHNAPGMPVGSFAVRPGPMLAAADFLYIDIQGKGGHAARPHQCIDPVVVGSHLVLALQSIVSRGVDPLESAVLSICVFRAGDVANVIPDTARIEGTVRTLMPEVQDTVERRIRETVAATAQMFGAEISMHYERLYPITTNHHDQAMFAASVAGDVAGNDKVDTTVPPTMGGEDFSFMLQARPGAMILTGNGDSASLHHPKYNFNDDVIPHGVSYWARLIETAAPAS